MKDLKKVKQGKKNRASGAAFELRVRKDLSEKGWIVDKWSNNVEFTEPTEEQIVEARQKNHTLKTMGNFKYVEPINGKLIQAKNKWAGPNRPMMMGAGFPDFNCMKRRAKFGEIHSSLIGQIFKLEQLYEVIGVECKTNGYLDKQEKEKCVWLLENKVFSKILIAEKTKVKNIIVIIYHDFEEKYGKI